MHHKIEHPFSSLSNFLWFIAVCAIWITVILLMVRAV